MVDVAIAASRTQPAVVKEEHLVAAVLLQAVGDAPFAVRSRGEGLGGDRLVAESQDEAGESGFRARMRSSRACLRRWYSRSSEDPGRPTSTWSSRCAPCVAPVSSGVRASALDCCVQLSEVTAAIVESRGAAWDAMWAADTGPLRQPWQRTRRADRSQPAHVPAGSSVPHRHTPA